MPGRDANTRPVRLAERRVRGYHALASAQSQSSTEERSVASTEPEFSDQHDQQYILGSAETLSPEESAERLRALAAWGVDLSLIQATLELTPTERLQRMTDFLAVGAALHLSYVRRIHSDSETLHEPM